MLEDYLDDFPGAVIAVSHDRYFLDRLAVRTFAFEQNGRIGHYTGGYSKYMNDKEAEEDRQPEKQVRECVSSKPVQKMKKLRFTFSEQREYETIESDIERIEKEISDVEAAVLEHSSDFEMLRELGERKEMLDNELMEMMDRWEYLNELAVRIERGEMVEV